MSVEPYDINTFLVQSRTREDVKHIVDLSDFTCSCESALDFKTSSPRDPCPHIEAAIYYATHQETEANR